MLVAPARETVPHAVDTWSLIKEPQNEKESPPQKGGLFTCMPTERLILVSALV